MAAAAEITMVKTRMRMPSDSSRVNGKTLARSEQRKHHADAAEHDAVLLADGDDDGEKHAEQHHGCNR